MGEFDKGRYVGHVLHFEPQSDVMSQHITVITQGFNEKNFIIFDCFVQWSSTSFFGYRSISSSPHADDD